MKAYWVEYRLYQHSEVKGIQVIAPTKEEAYIKAIFISIKKKEGTNPYSAWVNSVTFNNGNHHTFNTFEGKPY